MKKKDINSTDTTALRRKAEELLNIHELNSKLNISEIDTFKLIHELEVHKIELEMQNEELNIAKEKAEHAQEKYTELYDFAPNG